MTETPDSARRIEPSATLAASGSANEAVSANAPTPMPEFAPTSSGNKVAWVIGIVILILGIALMIGFYFVVRHWFALPTGTLHGGPDIYYNFWSGFGSDLGEATLISAVWVGVYTGVRKVNCHTKSCWRIGHHPLDGTPYVLCRHHHPDVPNHGATQRAHPQRAPQVQASDGSREESPRRLLTSNWPTSLSLADCCLAAADGTRTRTRAAVTRHRFARPTGNSRNRRSERPLPQVPLAHSGTP
jgi:hypothetical protein